MENLVDHNRDSLGEFARTNPLSNEGILLPQYLNPLQLTQEKEKSSVDQGFTGCVNIFLLECSICHTLDPFY